MGTQKSQTERKNPKGSGFEVGEVSFQILLFER